MTKKGTAGHFGQDDVVKYLENKHFRKNNPRPNDVLKFALDEELKANSEPTEEMKDRYREYVDECVNWTIYHMFFDDIFSSTFAEHIKCAEQENDYGMFIACIHGFLEGVSADIAFSNIKDAVMSDYIAKAKSTASAAVLDMLHIQNLQAYLNNAIKHGAVMPFNKHMKDLCTSMDPNKSFDKCIEDRCAYLYSKSAPVVLYVPSKYTGYGIIVASCAIGSEDTEHPRIRSTYGGHIPCACEPHSRLDSVDAYLHWTPDNNDANAPWQPDGLCIAPKGIPPTSERAFYWHAHTSWPNDIKPPLCPNTTMWIDDWLS